MRPVRIEAEGFLAYRDRAVVDFTGVDFFSLTGPTGSGKSSLIDAMVFALYGRVPRLGGKAVAPAIKAGVNRARVRFFFEIDDVMYDATRMAERTPGGASVKEARLQRGEIVLASGPGDVSKAVEELLRLRFDDFTRTVVLPQGEFARFLKDPPGERQELLRSLLGLDLFVEVRHLAKTRAAVQGERADRAGRALAALELADEEGRQAAVARRDALQLLVQEITAQEKELAELERAIEEAGEHQAALADAAQRLDALEAPPRLDELEMMGADARSRLGEAEEAHQAATERLGVLEARSASLPSLDQIAGWTRARERLQEIEPRLQEDDLSAARAAVEDADAKLATAAATLQDTRDQLVVAQREHAAHLLAADLVRGEPCPVCSREVSEIPARTAEPALDDLAGRERQADEEVARHRMSVEEARAALIALETRRAALTEQRESIETDLADAPSPDQMASLRAELEDLRATLETIRDLVRRTDVERKSAAKELEEIIDASRQVAKSLTMAQLSVADLGPPVSESDDVTVRWKELLAWRDETRASLETDMAEARAALATAETAGSKLRHGLRAELEKHGLDPIEPFATQASAALHEARATVERHQAAAEQAVDLEAEIEEATRSAAVATALVRHLQANGFEQWLMVGALADLVEGANDLLAQLSDGGYSLNSDESGGFSIIDHRNADEMRPISTLSGGETFQSSLALALSLAETLAAQGDAKLDAVIIDEGFGSLDTDESLDIAGAVLENLTAGGLMVGVITHVKELAARAAARFEVVREPTGAVVRSVP